MPVTPQTPLARFLFSRGEVNASGRVMATGFMPHWYEPSRQFEFSTYDTEALPAQTILDIARDVEAGRGKTCRGWATTAAGTYMNHGLECDPDDVPPRHVTVIGWPPIKEDQKALAQLIAAMFVEGGGRFEPRPA